MPRKVLKFEQRIGGRLSGLFLVQCPAGAGRFGLQPFDSFRKLGNPEQLKVFTLDQHQGCAPCLPWLGGFFDHVFAPLFATSWFG